MVFCCVSDLYLASLYIYSIYVVSPQFYLIGEMKKGKNYFRIDGSVDGKNRSKATDYFNKAYNHQ